ncbi:tRNA (adenine(22)-N(1))-methyltransferase [Bacillus sp. PS06]|uniref:tRNA (adenine(22)-N(1))-methyltransferase n=1 Tax=Bacillus sp. PS06 TaxID=2764176 RepID=UPI00177B9419|nr:tRNA (adenine(22)-N(1))-methyltransferase TrmK [Bacillus sp. PS06]MBD8069175.1 tRNA (adenine-N(1))-methyltransferase [Bacillus sp. PS06]
MNELQLSKRLEAVASNIPSDSILADIGSDHAYLPCYAYLKGQIVSAIAGEINEGPFRSAQEQVMKSNLADVIEVRKGNGLEVIDPNEVDCITIAGMGGTLITTILEEGSRKLEGVSRLILQPNIGAINIRKWLLAEGWEITSETILEEDGKIYEIIVADRGNPEKPYDDIEAGLLLGPFLLKEKNEAFIKKWTHEKQHWMTILTNLQQAEPTAENMKKQNEIEGKLAILKEVLDEQNS